MKRKAFNFAEVMITMTVIGVVAALTMPGLVAHYHEKEYVSQLAKALSQYEQAMQNIMFRHECTDIECTGVYSSTTSDNDWNNKFEEEMRKSIKIVKIAKSGTAIMPSIRSKYLKPKDTYLTTDEDWRSTSGFKFMTPDGVMYLVEPKGCVQVAHQYISTINTFCAEVLIDVNSERRPNQYGRDIFKFIVAQNGHLYPLYGRDYAKAFSGNTTGSDYWRNNKELCAGDGILPDGPPNVSGDGCAARIMEEGWKMNY